MTVVPLPNPDPPRQVTAEYLTITEVADYLRVGRTTVYRLRRDHGLPSVRWGARSRRFRRVDVDRWVREQSAKEEAWCRSDGETENSMSVERISHDDYLRLLGLFVLAREHNRRLNEITRAAARIVGEEPDDGTSNYFGHVSDEVYVVDPDVDDMLRRMGVELEPPVVREDTA